MIELKSIVKTYNCNGVSTEALKGVDLTIEEGELLAVMGRSGSGKTTLLNIIGGMDDMTSGRYIFKDIDVGSLKGKKLHEFRRDHISFVFQSFELMDQYTVYENVEMPLIAKNIRKKERKTRVEEVLKDLDIYDISKKYPTQLSGGQKQRVAIARALITGSEVILADEPTGSLDMETGQNVMNILKRINDNGKTVVVITHDMQIASQCNRVVTLADGFLSE